MHKYLAVACLFSIFIISPSALAAVFCVDNASQLQDALDEAADNGEDDQIRLTLGVYQGTFRFSSSELFDIEIIGGFTSLLGAPCQLPSSDPRQTVLDAEEHGRTLFIRGGEGSNVTIRNLTFVNGDASSESVQDGGGLWIDGLSTGLARARIENSLFINNWARNGSAIVFGAAEFMELRNNVIDGNVASGNYAVFMENDLVGVHAINNTLINNTAPPSNQGGLNAAVFAGAQALIVNNILWANSGRQLNASSTNSTVRNNTIGPQDLTFPDNLSVAPEFSEGIMEYGLLGTSPLIDSGITPQRTEPPIPFPENWTLPVTDLVGKDRILGETVDIGAVEAIPDRVFFDRFED
jgi:hypothetical protein